jgi:outer membrane receptor protein involved in Fe transport
VNVPLSDTWAIRASAFTREDGGYIDNIQSGENDVNSLESKGGRLAAMWRPNDNFSLKLAAVFQDTNTNGSPAADLSLLAPLGDLQQRRLADTGGYDKKMRLFSAALTAKLGAGELVSVTGYGVNTIFTHLDISAIGFLAQPIFGSASVRSDVQYDTDKLTQELRYSLSIGERVQWLIGAFYTDESTDQDQVTPVIGATPVADPVTGEPVGYFFKTHSVRTFEERAAFTNLTFDVTDRLDVQVGGRWSENKIQNGAQSRRGFIYCSTAANRLCAAPANANYAGLNPEANAGDSPITYLLTPRFRVSPDLMLYARFASGYRPGGPNSNPSFLISAGAPLEYESDTTQNYELGIKGSLWDRRLTFEASVYHIQWKDIQLSFRQPNPPFATFNVNGGEAKSEGVELSVESKPLRGLTLSGWVSLGEAELTEDFPVGSVLAGSKGDRLPLSSRNSANFSVDQEFPIGSVTAFVGGTVSHIGEREDVFRAPGLARFNLPAYTQVDLRAGVRYESWAVNLFGTNITDKRGFLVGDPSVGGAVIYTQPRTVGLSLEKSF